jgi:DNA-binding SARP family transcriptional activator
MTVQSALAGACIDVDSGEPTAELPVIATMSATVQGATDDGDRATRPVRNLRQIARIEAFGLLVAVVVPIVLWHVAGWPDAKKGRLALGAAVALVHGRVETTGLVDAFVLVQWAMWAALVASAPRALRGVADRRPSQSPTAHPDPPAPRAHGITSRPRSLRAHDPDGCELGWLDAERPRGEEAGILVVGSRGGERVHLALRELAGVSIQGPGAEEIVRMLVVRAISAHASSSVLVSDEVAERLFAGAPPCGALRRVASPEALGRTLEAERLARARRVAEQLATPELEGDDPGATAPLLVVAGAIPAHLHVRWFHVLAASPWIVAMFVEPTPLATSSVRVDRDRIVLDATPATLARRLYGAVLDGLGEDEASAELRALGHVQASPSVPEDRFAARDRGRPDAARAPRQHLVEVLEDARGTPARAPVTVRVLGTLCVSTLGMARTAGMRSRAKALLVYFVCHRGGASVERAVDELWPEVGRDEVVKQFWRALGDLRSHLHHHATGHLQVLSKVGDHYRCNEAEVTCDLWDFEDALEVAAAATSDEAHASLRRAVDAYRGELLDGWDLSWAEPMRERLRRRAHDACLRLGALEAQAGRLDAALGALERALDVDPYAEAGYCELMRLQAERGRPDAVDATWQLLCRQLSDLGARVSPSTASLYRRLVHSR